MRNLKKGDKVLIRTKAERYEVVSVLGEMFFAYTDSFIKKEKPKGFISKTEAFNQNEVIYHYTKEDLENE